MYFRLKFLVSEKRVTENSTQKTLQLSASRLTTRRAYFRLSLPTMWLTS